MGLTKQYLRFIPGPVFGIISSSTAGVLFLDYSDGAHLVAVPACENVLLWNYRTGEKVKVFCGDKHSVTCLVSDPKRKALAVGYADGSIRVFDVISASCIVSFCGHKSAISSLAFDMHSLRIASGGKDTEIVLWDVVGEAGLFRLKGHKGPVTKCAFFKQRNILITSSEDMLLKFWDLDSQHCFKTLVGNQGEIWDFLLINDFRLITGVNDSDLRVWDLHFKDFIKESEVFDSGRNQGEESDNLDILTIIKRGKILTQGEKKTMSLLIDPSGKILGSHGYSKCLHLFKILDSDEALKKFRKRKRKEQKRLKQNPEAQIAEPSFSLIDEVERMKSIQTESKVVAFDIRITKNNFEIVTLLNNNTFSVYGFPSISKDAEPTLLYSIKSAGHRSGVNALAFSSDNLMLLSASNEAAKIWNTCSQRCTHTFECEVALCAAFLTGDNYCIVGTKLGKLQIFDLTSHQLVENVDAHSGNVNSVYNSPDQRGIMSGSSDKDVKFWDYELVKDEDYSLTKKRLTLVHARTLKLSEEVLCLKCSPNQKFLAMALLDMTVKIFFHDTLKFLFSLYGHKLPVICIDISYDSTLLVTGSRDKNVKIWSLEFGNCVKSIFAHDESITCIEFLPKTHMFFTCSKDKMIKQWDGDNFQKIVTLEGHQSKINALAISADGTTVATASSDRSLRFWEKTNEPLVLEEEHEMEREEETDKQLASEEPVITGEKNKEVGLATKTTIDTLKTVEQLIEAIDIHKVEVEKLQEYENQRNLTGKDIPLPVVDPMLTAYSVTCPYKYILKIIQKSRSSYLEQILLHLPFSYVLDLLNILSEFSSRKWEVELTTRCMFFLLRIHLGQISVSQDTLPLIDKLKAGLIDDITQVKDTVGFNIAGLKFLQKQIEGCEEISLVNDAMTSFKRKHRKRRLIALV